MVELTWVKLGWVVKAAKRQGVSFELNYCEASDSFYFRILSPAKSECTITKNRDFDGAVSDALEWLDGLKQSA